MPKGRRVRPISSKGDPSLRFRYMDDRPTGRASIDWSSCKSHISKAFKNDIFAKPRKGGFYLSNSDLALIGLAGTALLPAALAYAYAGPVNAIFTFQGGFARGLLYATNRTIGSAVMSAPVAGALAGLVGVKKPEVVNFNQPCNENRGAAF